MNEPRAPGLSGPETAAFVPQEAEPATHLRADEAATLPPSPGSSGQGSWPGGLPTELPANLGRYELRRLLGKGGMGAVYLAHDLQLDRAVALKIPFFSAQEGQSLRERFFREAKAAGVLSHPNLCPVYDVGEINGVHYLSMAYLEGQTLAELLRGQPRMAQREAATLVRTLALALQEAHDRGIIHRDLKPANVMVNQRQQPIIMDFGLARQTVSDEESRLTKSGTLLGTPAYMPPEQINSDLKAMGPGCDIYSLGVILYEMLTGKLPFEGPLGTLMATILMDPPPLPSLARPDLDSTLEMICLKTLAKSPRDRFPSMAAFAAALTDYLDGRTVNIEAPPPPSRNTPMPVVLAVPEEETPEATLLPPETEKKTRGGVGCGGVVLGCGLMLLLGIGLVVGGGMWIVHQFMPDWKNFAAFQMQPGQNWDEIARFWSPPPADATGEKLFPAEVMQFKLQTQGPVDGVADLEIKAKGFRAVYRSPNGEVEVFVFRAKLEEKQHHLICALGIIAPKEDKGVTVQSSRTSNANRFHSVSGSPQSPWLRYSFGMPIEQQGFFWWDKDWLFLVRSVKVTATEQFLKEMLAKYGKEPARVDKPRTSTPRGSETMGTRK